MMTRRDLSKIVVAQALSVIALSILLSIAYAGCAGNPPPKVLIDRADRAAFTALRSFQQIEEASYHARAPWPTKQQHADIGAKLSHAYDLVIDVANVGLALQQGVLPSPQAIDEIANLQKTVIDIIALVTAQAPLAAQQAAANIQTETQKLAASVHKGAR